MARTYLVVIDDSAEARVALRFAARRAAKTGGAVEVLAIVQPQDFVQWGGVQAAIEEEQRLRIEAQRQPPGRRDRRRRRDQAAIVDPRRASRSRSCALMSATRDDIAALVLGAAPSGRSGAAGRRFHRQRRGQTAVPGDDHPGQR